MCAGLFCSLNPCDIPIRFDQNRFDFGIRQSLHRFVEGQQLYIQNFMRIAANRLVPISGAEIGCLLAVAVAHGVFDSFEETVCNIRCYARFFFDLPQCGLHFRFAGFNMPFGQAAMAVQLHDQNIMRDAADFGIQNSAAAIFVLHNSPL